MEKIAKEVLMKKLLNNQLSDDELEKISGASKVGDCAKDCLELSHKVPFTVLQACMCENALIFMPGGIPRRKNAL